MTLIDVLNSIAAKIIENLSTLFQGDFGTYTITLITIVIAFSLLGYFKKRG